MKTSTFLLSSFFAATVLAVALPTPPKPVALVVPANVPTIEARFPKPINKTMTDEMARKYCKKLPKMFRGKWCKKHLNETTSHIHWSSKAQIHTRDLVLADAEIPGTITIPDELLWRMGNLTDNQDAERDQLFDDLTEFLEKNMSGEQKIAVKALEAQAETKMPGGLETRTDTKRPGGWGKRSEECAKEGLCKVRCPAGMKREDKTTVVIGGFRSGSEPFKERCPGIWDGDNIM